MSSTITSRVGRKPVVIPAGVNISLIEDDRKLKIKGSKGELIMPIHPDVKIEVADGTLVVNLNDRRQYCRKGSGRKTQNAIPGTIRSNIQNAVDGVSKGFERKLTLVGVGYRAQAKGKVIALSLGYSHPIDFPLPEGITAETPTPTEIILRGTDKHLVGHTASKIRALRGPEPYKGKGVRYSDEQVDRKETKKK